MSEGDLTDRRGRRRLSRVADEKPPEDVAAFSVNEDDASAFKSGITIPRRGRRGNQNRAPSEEEVKQLFWDELKADKNYSGHEYSSAIFQDKDFTEDELELTDDWLHASEVVYDMEYGENAWADKTKYWSDDRKKAEIDEWGLGYMGRFNYNIPIMTANAIQVVSDETSLDQKIAFKYMMDAYEHKGQSLYGWGRAIAGMSYDPSAWLGFATAGTVAVGAQAAKKVALQILEEGIRKSLTTSIGRATMMSTLKTGLKTANRPAFYTGMTLLTVEGAAYTWGDDANRQRIDLASGAQDEWDYKRSGISMVMGGAAAYGIGKALPIVGRNAKDWAINTKNFVDFRTNTTLQKTITAGAIIATPVGTVSANAYFEDRAQERERLQGEQIMAKLDELNAEKNNIVLAEMPPVAHIKGAFTDSSALPNNNGAFSPYTSTNPNQTSAEFNNTVYGLRVSLNQPITIVISAEDALKIENSLKS